MPSIERYIVREVLKPFSFVLLILVFLFACFSGARYLAEAVTETLGAYFMLKLILLKTFIALEVLVPIALYVSVVIGLGRLHRDQEIIALRAAGIGNGRVIGSVAAVAALTALLVGVLSLYARPWAYETSYLLDARAKAEMDADRFQPGRFYGNEETGAVIYLGGRDDADGAMSEVFYYLRDEDVSEVALAATAVQRGGREDNRMRVDLNDGRLYRLQRNATADELSDYARLVKFQEESDVRIGYRRKAAATSDLRASAGLDDVAEFQWRLSKPVTTLLLALIAIPLSRSSPRQGKYEKVFLAALAFAVYYNLSGIARSWVERGVVGEFPGIWWLHFSMALVVLIFLWPPRPRRRRRKARG